MTTVFNYVDGLCGSGKTHAAIKAIHSNPFQKTILAVPTKNLADQCHRDFASAGITKFKNITTDTLPSHRSVAGAILQQTKQYNKEEGGSIITTHAAMSFLPRNAMGGRDEWNLINDEIPQIDFFYEPCIPNNFNKITDLIELGDKFIDDIWTVKLKDKEVASQWLSGCHDDMDQIIQPIINGMVNEDMMLVRASSWNKVVSGLKSPDVVVGKRKTGGNKVFFMRLVTPASYSGFKSTTFMGANFTMSLFYDIWSRIMDVEFNAHPQITKNLRYADHSSVAKRLKITYLQENNYSKCQANTSRDGRKLADTYARKAHEVMGSDDALCVLNKDDASFKPAKWTQISPMSHGLNEYQDYTNIYFGAALNRPPQHIKMLMDIGVSQEIIYRSSAIESAYQTLMRTALRNPDSAEIVQCVVVDKATAEAIAMLFPGCLIGPVDGIQKKAVVVPKSSAEMKHKTRLEIAKAQLALDDRIVIGETDETGILVNGFNDIRSQSTYTERMTPTEFTGVMKKVHTNNIIDSKTDNALFNTTEFNGNRTTENVVSSGMVAIDCDGGEMTPDEFSSVFSDVSHIITNSASNDGTNNRFRALFFVDKEMTVDTHLMVFDYLVARLEKNNFYTVPQGHTQGDRLEEFMRKLLKRNPLAKISGVDMSKRSPTSLFYLPCQIKGREQHAFFRSFHTDVRGLKRHAIKVDKIVAMAHIDSAKVKLVLVDPSEIITEELPNAIDEKIINRAIKDLGNLRGGDRSSMACKIAGYCSKLSNTILKHDVLNRLMMAGCDTAAMQSARKYIKLI